jgi:[ribosomal protein S5]-alanine N-acetyltransferase
MFVYETIETPRLLLRIITPEVLDNMFGTLSESELKQELGSETEEEWQKELWRYDGSYTKYNQSMVFFQLRDKNSGAFLGGCGFHTWFPEHRRAEVGYHLKNQEMMGKGLMTEALKPVIEYGFETMSLNRIEAVIGPDNLASQRLVKRLGFEQEGYMKQHYNSNGVLVDSILFALLREDY